MRKRKSVSDYDDEQHEGVPAGIPELGKRAQALGRAEDVGTQVNPVRQVLRPWRWRLETPPLA